MTFEGHFAASHGLHGYRYRGLALPRETLDTIVLGRAGAAGARIVEGAQVVDVLRTDARRVCGVRVRDADGEREFAAPLVVGADGLRSVVARRLGLARSARWPRRVAFVSHWRGVAGMGACGEMHVSRTGYCGLADVSDSVTNLAVVVPASRARDARGDADGFVDRWIAAHAELAARFAPAERVSPVRVTGPFAARARRAWAPGAALVGDAADFFDPFTGEGIYAALRGGELLGPYLYDALHARDATMADVALAAYDRCRRHEFAGKWRMEQLVGVAVGVPALLNRVARALATRPHLADLFVGAAGDFVPTHEVLRPKVLFQLLVPLRSRA